MRGLITGLMVIVLVACVIAGVSLVVSASYSLVMHTLGRCP